MKSFENLKGQTISCIQIVDDGIVFDIGDGALYKLSGSIDRLSGEIRYIIGYPVRLADDCGDSVFPSYMIATVSDKLIIQTHVRCRWHRLDAEQ